MLFQSLNNRLGSNLILTRLNFCHFSGKCNPNPCLNNGECELKGKRKFKCDCPKPFKGRKCEKGLIKNPFSHAVVGLQTGYIYSMHKI